MSIFSFKSAGKTSEDATSAKFKSIIDKLQDAVVVYDKDFKVTIFNPSAERIFKVKSAEVVGFAMGPDKVTNPRFTVLVQTLFPSLAPIVSKRTETGVYPQVVDISFPTLGLELRTSTSPIVSGDESAGFVKVITDRTKEVEYHKSKSEFVDTAAHQLRGPVTNVSWAFDTLRKSPAISAEDKNIAEQGFIASQKLLKIVTDLLDVVKIEEGKFGYELQTVDLISFAKEAAANAKDYIKRAGLSLNVNLDYGSENQIPVTADLNKLGVAISNILDNAIKYNIKNGAINIRIERMKGSPFVQMSIADTGIGIPEGDLNKIFGKFFRAENAKRVEVDGSGLGLYIAKNIIKRHGGDMRVESAVGRGTTVYFTLPTDPKLVPTAELVYQE